MKGSFAYRSNQVILERIVASIFTVKSLKHKFVKIQETHKWLLKLASRISFWKQISFGITNAAWDNE